MNLFKRLFGKKQSSEEKQEKELAQTIQTLKIDGIKALKTGQIDVAKAFYKRILELKENDLDGLIYLSKIYVREHNLIEAASYLEQASKILPTAEIKINLMSLYHLLHEDTKILELSNIVLEQEPENTAAYYYQGIAYQELKDPFNAIASLTKCLTIESYHLEALLLRAKILYQMNQMNDAVVDINKILERDKNNEEAHLLKARILEFQNDFDGAYLLYKKIAEINPFNIAAYHRAAQIFIDKKDFNKALEILNETIELSPDVADSYYLRGKTNFLLANKEASLEDYKKLIELDPERKNELDGQFEANI